MREEWKRWRRHTDTTDYWIVRLKRTMTTELLYALLRMQGDAMRRPYEGTNTRWPITAESAPAP